MSREPDLEAVNRTLAVTVQKQQADLKAADRTIRTLQAALRQAAEHLDRAGYRQSAELARDAAQC